MAHNTIDPSAKKEGPQNPETQTRAPVMGQTETPPVEISNPEAIEIEDDADATDDNAPRKKGLGFYLSFFAINILILSFSLDATTLAVALPAIASEFRGSTLESFWAGIAYYLGLVVSQPLYASISDVFGRKPPLYVAFVLFLAGSLTFSLAWHMAAIIAGRIVQGMGGGGLDVLGDIIVSDMTTLRERPLYLGITALPLALGSILGPTVGALFSDFVTWRWIGWINIVLLGVACPLLLIFLRLRPLESSLGAKVRRLDWAGMATFAAGSTLFVLPLSWADALYPWGSYQTIVPLVLGAAVLIVFGIYEAKPEAPLMPHKLFRSRTMTVSLIGAFIQGMSLFTLLQYLPLFYQAVMLDTRIGSAVTLLPTSILSVMAAIGSMIVIGKAGTGYREWIWLAWILVTVGTGLLCLLDASSSAGMRYGIPIVWSVGAGALLRLLQIPIQASVPSVDDTAHAIALLLTVRCFGSLVGLAIGSTIFNSVFGPAIAAVGELPDALGVLRDPHQAIAFIPMLRTLDLPADVVAPVLQAYVTAMRAIFYAMIAFSGLGFVTSLATEELTLQRTERGRQQFET
ncbi:MFS general substrate transporter [Hypoxylon sp. NC1633]|nr:MFS general substrate transporter [Hypoxylon sp. NC1633]